MSGFFTELFRALFQATLPLAAFSFALVWWAVKRGYFKGEGGVRGLDREVKALNKSRKLEKKQNKLDKKRRKQATRNGEKLEPQKKTRKDPIAEKWMQFGGGFYGLVAFYTYVLIEWDEIADFISNFGGFWQMIRNISVGALIDLFIDSIMNFVAAITWPIYWLARTAGEWIWVWLVAAYAGYWIGTRLAQHAVAKEWGVDINLPLGLRNDDEDD